MDSYSSDSTTPVSDEGEGSEESRSSPEGQRSDDPQATNEGQRSQGQRSFNEGHESDNSRSTIEDQMPSLSISDGQNHITGLAAGAEGLTEEEERKYLTSASTSHFQNDQDSLDDSQSSAMSGWLSSSASTVRGPENTSAIQNIDVDHEVQNMDDVVQNWKAEDQNRGDEVQNIDDEVQNMDDEVQNMDDEVQNRGSGTGGVMHNLRTERGTFVLGSEETELRLNAGSIGPIISSEPSDEHHPMENRIVLGDDIVEHPLPNYVQMGNLQQLSLSIDELVLNQDSFPLHNSWSGVILRNQDDVRPTAGQYEIGSHFVPWDPTAKYGLNNRVMKCEDRGSKRAFIAKQYYPKNFNRCEVELSCFPLSCSTLGLVWNRYIIYLFQEYCDGIVLSELLKQRPTLSSEEVNWLYFTMLQGLDRLHQSGIIHRNIDPEHIIISRKKVKLYVVGGSSLCKIRDCLSVPARETLHSSPEMARSEDHDGSTDIYSLGTVLHRCLSGRPIFFPMGRQQRSLKNYVHDIGNGRYPVSEHLAGIEPTWHALITNMTNPEMSRRPSARDLLRDCFYEEPRWREGFFEDSYSSRADERELPLVGNIPSDEIVRFYVGDDEIQTNDNEQGEETSERSDDDDVEQTHPLVQPRPPKKVESFASTDTGFSTDKKFQLTNMRDVPSVSYAASLERLAHYKSEGVTTSRNLSVEPSRSRVQGLVQQPSDDESMPDNLRITIRENERDCGVLQLPNESFGRDLVTAVGQKLQLNCGCILRYQGNTIRFEDKLSQIFPLRNVVITMERQSRDQLIPRQNQTNMPLSPQIPRLEDHTSEALSCDQKSEENRNQIDSEEEQSHMIAARFRSTPGPQDVPYPEEPPQMMPTQQLPGNHPKQEPKLNGQVSVSSSDPICSDLEDNIASSPETASNGGGQPSPRGNFGSYVLSAEAMQFSDSFVAEFLGELDDDRPICYDSDSSLVTHPALYYQHHQVTGSDDFDNNDGSEKEETDVGNAIIVKDDDSKNQPQHTASLAERNFVADNDDDDDDDEQDKDQHQHMYSLADGNATADDDEDDDDDKDQDTGSLDDDEHPDDDFLNEEEQQKEQEVEDDGSQIVSNDSSAMTKISETRVELRRRHIGAQEINLDDNLENTSEDPQFDVEELFSSSEEAENDVDRNNDAREQESHVVEDVMSDTDDVMNEADDVRSPQRSVDQAEKNENHSDHMKLHEENIELTGSDSSSEDSDNEECSDGVELGKNESVTENETIMENELEINGLDQNDVSSDLTKAEDETDFVRDEAADDSEEKAKSDVRATDLELDSSDVVFSEAGNLTNSSGTWEVDETEIKDDDDAVRDKSGEDSEEVNDSGCVQDSSNNTFSEAMTDEAFSPLSENDSFPEDSFQ